MRFRDENSYRGYELTERWSDDERYPDAKRSSKAKNIELPEPPEDIKLLHDEVKHLLPTQRGNVAINNLIFLCALQHKAKSGCHWRHMPEEYGKWVTIHQRFRRWNEKGVFEYIEKRLRKKGFTVFPWTSLLIEKAVTRPEGRARVGTG